MDLSVIHDLFQESAQTFLYSTTAVLMTIVDCIFCKKNTIHVNNFLIYKLGILLLRPSFH